MCKHSKYYFDKLRNMDIKYFQVTEFDCKCKVGTGINMELAFIKMLDECRELAGIPFKITSGYRCLLCNNKLIESGIKASKNSSHMSGVAADISAKTSAERYKILESAIKVGFKRIGIGKNFIHLDIDRTKTPNLIWTYY